MCECSELGNNGGSCDDGDGKRFEEAQPHHIGASSPKPEVAQRCGDRAEI